MDVSLPNPDSHTNPIVARAKAKAKAKAKVNPKDPILTPRRSPRFQAAIFKLAMLSAITSGWSGCR